MQNIVSSVQRVTEVIAHIAASAREQSDGIALVNDAIAQLDQATQQNAALVEELCRCRAQSLREQAYRLAQAASTFKVADSAAPLRRPAMGHDQPRSCSSLSGRCGRCTQFLRSGPTTDTPSNAAALPQATRWATLAGKPPSQVR